MQLNKIWSLSFFSFHMIEMQSKRESSMSIPQMKKTSSSFKYFGLLKLIITQSPLQSDLILKIIVKWLGQRVCYCGDESALTADFKSVDVSRRVFALFMDSSHTQFTVGLFPLPPKKAPVFFVFFFSKITLLSGVCKVH